MKKVIVIAVLGIMFYAVSASAFTAGRDNQPVTVTSGTVTITPSGTQAVSNQALTDAAAPETGINIKQKTGEVFEVTQSDTSINDGGGSLTVDFTAPDTTVQATDLDIRNLTAATDTVHVDSPILATVSGAVTNDILTSAAAGDTSLNIRGTATTIMSDITLADSMIDIALTDTDTVYSYALPAKTVAYEFSARGTGVVQWSIVDNTAATTYLTLKSGYPYNTFGLGSEKLFTGTLYFKCPLTAGEIIELHVITKP